TSPQSFKSSTGSPLNRESSSKFSSSPTKPSTALPPPASRTSCTHTLQPATSDPLMPTSSPPLTQSKHRTWGYRAFSVTAPALWNSLPQHLRHSPSLLSFKTALKTHLFNLLLICNPLLLLLLLFLFSLIVNCNYCIVIFYPVIFFIQFVCCFYYVKCL
ncbi:hypothetical protein LDENG_00194270, partial [Lucifuga dentata]